MALKQRGRLNPKQRYLQIALNSTLSEARAIIDALPASERILIEAGTPLIKEYGMAAIRSVYMWYAKRLDTNGKTTGTTPYVVADLKTMDRGTAEVTMAAQAGASAAVVLGAAPVETIDAFIDSCEYAGLDAMVDMMNIKFPLSVLGELKRQPRVVILHRGVDEEAFSKEKKPPLYEIRRIKGRYNTLISVAGGDALREVQRAVFNDADIVIAWQSFYRHTQETAGLATRFLKEVS